MAPELRKRKDKTSADTAKKATSGPKAAKRKAAEDASPIPVKKQKAAKTATAPTPSKKSAKEVEDAVKPAIKEKKAPKKSVLKKGKKAVVEEPEPEPQQSEQEDVFGSEEEGDEEADKQTQALVRTIDDEEDEEDMPEPKDAFKEGQDVGKVPKTVKKLPAKKGPEEDGEPGVVYLGRIPHGFHEREMRSYFSQFSPVTRLRLSRNKHTGKSKHYAFIEFGDREVADIVAKTMDNYLLFGHVLRARVVPPDQVHPALFKGANRRFKTVPWNRMEGRHLEKPAGETTWKNRIDKETKRRGERAAKLKELMDYEYEVPELKMAEVKPPAVEAAEESRAVEAGEETKTIDAPAEAPVEVATIAPVEKADASEKVEAVEDMPEPAQPAKEAKKAKAGKKASKSKKVKA